MYIFSSIELAEPIGLKMTSERGNDIRASEVNSTMLLISASKLSLPSRYPCRLSGHFMSLGLPVDLVNDLFALFVDDNACDCMFRLVFRPYARIFIVSLIWLLSHSY